MVRNPLAHECGGNCATFGKSVLFWAHGDFEYKYGAGFRDKSLTNSDQNIFNVNEDFETKEERKSHVGNSYTRWGNINVWERDVFRIYYSGDS